MSINGIDMSIKESGWYELDERKEDMKNDDSRKNFTRNDIFLE